MKNVLSAVICLKVLAVECILPNKLKRHFETLHPILAGKPTELFKKKLSGVQQQNYALSKFS